MKNNLLILFSHCCLLSFGQVNFDNIKKVNSTGQAETFIKANPHLKAEIIEITSAIDNSIPAKKIISQGDENPVIEGEYIYKLIDARKTFLLNAFYIYLDGNKFSVSQIDSVRKIIISKFNSGISFANLAKEFNMDGNPEPNLKSIAENYLVKGFSEAVKAHKTGEVFTIDVPDKKWYYVTQKTADDQETKTYSVLKVKNKN